MLADSRDLKKNRNSPLAAKTVSFFSGTCIHNYTEPVAYISILVLDMWSTLYPEGNAAGV
jgi:hypothetical protein